MKLRNKVVCASALAVMISGCGGDDSGEKSISCDAQTFINACTKDGKGMFVCVEGILTSLPCAQGVCDAERGACVDAESCTEATYPATCLDERTLTYCNNGKKAQETCAENATCDAVSKSCKTADMCTAADFPASCKDDATRIYCNGGVKTEERCVAGTTCRNGVCETVETSVNCSNDPNFSDYCESPRVRVYCDNGEIKRETCKGGKICNGSLKKKTCSVPNVGETCSVNAFAEMCYGDSVARICDKETGKVVAVDCTSLYGDGYKCDVKEDYYGAGKDVATCYSNAEKCTVENAEVYEYCYLDDDTGYRHFYKQIFLCGKFNTGLHLYIIGEEECPKESPKCGQEAIRHECLGLSEE